jgi:hypothetical protein
MSHGWCGKGLATRQLEIGVHSTRLSPHCPSLAPCIQNMPALFPYPHRPKSGRITCYLKRTYHVLTTQDEYKRLP